MLIFVFINFPILSYGNYPQIPSVIPLENILVMPFKIISAISTGFVFFSIYLGIYSEIPVEFPQQFGHVFFYNFFGNFFIKAFRISVSIFFIFDNSFENP